MKTGLLARLGLVAGAAALLLTVACADTGDMRSETRTIQRGDAASARVKLEMGAGELHVDGSASELARADFRYNVEKWKPIVDYAVADGVGALTVHQPDTKGAGFSRSVTNEWRLHLNKEIPTDLSVELGAGTSDLKLGGMALTALTVNTGAGETVIDLTGAWQRDLQARIEGGAGKVTVRLPRGVGTHVDADTGIGKVDADGFIRRSGAWVNDAYGVSPITLRIDVEAGVGAVVLVLAD